VQNDTDATLLARCDDFPYNGTAPLPDGLSQVCACDEPLACCFGGVAPADSCRDTLSAHECTAAGGTPVLDATTCAPDGSTCPRACQRDCDCGGSAPARDLCELSVCNATSGTCALDYKLDCPLPSCRSHRCTLTDDDACDATLSCSGINVRTGRPLVDGHCGCWCSGGALRGSNAVACDAHGQCPLGDDDVVASCDCVEPAAP